jgi:hypothetical protein
MARYRFSNRPDVASLFSRVPSCSSEMARTIKQVALVSAISTAERQSQVKRDRIIGNTLRLEDLEIRSTQKG